LAHNPIAYKWKAPFRSFVIRECTFWRFHDLVSQADHLDLAGHVLGARILLRSALETTAIIVYLNQQIERVVNGSLDFFEFSDKTIKLLMGTRNGTTNYSSINIISIIQSCEKRYPKIESVYATLSESAHPNWEGLCFGYSKVDHEEYESLFANRWNELRGDEFEELAIIVLQTFELEYNVEWIRVMEALESWINVNDKLLERPT